MPHDNSINEKVERNTPKTEGKFKETGQCRYYGQRQFWDSRCPQYKANLIVIEEEGYEQGEQLQSSNNLPETKTHVTSPTKEEQLVKYMSKH